MRILISLCNSAASICAEIHFLAIKYHLNKLVPVIQNAPRGIYNNLKRIWFARFFKRISSVLVRTPFRHHLFELIQLNFEHVPPGSVILSCHTPWARLIARWCDENKSAMIIGWGPWTKRSKIARHATGFNELRMLVKYLQDGGRVIIMADVFNDANNCPVTFLGKNKNVSLFPLRLTQAARGQLTTMIPLWENENIYIHEGPIFKLSNNKIDHRKILQKIFLFIENEIKQNPSVFLNYIRGPFR